MSINEPLVAEPQLKSEQLCKNCDTPLSGKYCSRCGQADKHLDPGMHDLWHEGVHEFLHLDGKILTTLKALLFRPGKLTLDHFSGRRARYIGPIRLYLTLSVIFFLLAAHSGRSKTAVVDKKTGEQQIVKIQTDDPKTQAAASAFEKHITNALQKTSEDPELFKHAFLTNVSRVMFLFVPLFALGLRVAYRNRHRKYPSFVYFSLHYFSVVFFALAVSELVEFAHLPILVTWTNRFLVLWCFAYLFMSLRRVFGGTWMRTTIRIAALGLIYLPCFAIGLAAAAIISLLTL